MDEDSCVWIKMSVEEVENKCHLVLLEKNCLLYTYQKSAVHEDKTTT